MKKIRLIFLIFTVFLIPLVFAECISASDFSFKGKVEPADNTARLLKYYVERFDPEVLELITDGQPDESGLFKNVYMNITGCNISGVRLDKLTFQITDAQFNNPELWEKGAVECLSALEVYAGCRLLEDDVNADLQKRVIGEGEDNWRNLKLRISPKGLHGSGEYTVKLIFALNISIEIDSKLRIVRGQEVWLEDTTLKVNDLSVPDYVIDMALGQIQPILNLKTLPIPLKLNKIIFKDKEALLETRVLPTKIQGTTYTYTK